MIFMTLVFPADAAAKREPMRAAASSAQVEHELERVVDPPHFVLTQMRDPLTEDACIHRADHLARGSLMA
jgi:hypothetical protein